jgi:hypothetical protein
VRMGRLVMNDNGHEMQDRHILKTLVVFDDSEQCLGERNNLPESSIVKWFTCLTFGTDLYPEIGNFYLFTLS